MEHYRVKYWQKMRKKGRSQFIKKHKWESFVWTIPISLWVFFSKCQATVISWFIVPLLRPNLPFSFHKTFYGFVSRKFVRRNSLLFLTKSTCFNLPNEVSLANPPFHLGELLVGIFFFKNDACRFILSFDFLKLLLQTQPLFSALLLCRSRLVQLLLQLAFQHWLQREMD